MPGKTPKGKLIRYLSAAVAKMANISTVMYGLLAYIWIKLKKICTKIKQEETKLGQYVAL